MVMKETAVPAGEFKAKCLAILDEVNETRRSVVITKRGRPVARLVPVETGDAFASLRGSILAETDVVSPLHDVWGTRK
jgi:prevent-host-death family protein